MPKSVELSVHKNTIEKRRKRELADSMASAARKMTKDCDIRAYALVGIGSDGEAYTSWDTGSVMPMWAFPSTVAEILKTDIGDARASGVREDWKPALKK